VVDPLDLVLQDAFGLPLGFHGLDLPLLLVDGLEGSLRGASDLLLLPPAHCHNRASDRDSDS
jgi:hypothetical protein